VLGAYRTAPEVTRERLHIEALEGILDQVELILLDEDAIGDQVLPFLPLTDPSASGARPSAPTPGPAPSPAPSPAPDNSDSTGEGE
jgi:membrane protease subunit HflK